MKTKKLYTTLCCKNRDFNEVIRQKFIVVVSHVEWSSICMSNNCNFNTLNIAESVVVVDGVCSVP